MPLFGSHDEKGKTYYIQRNTGERCYYKKGNKKSQQRARLKATTPPHFKIIHEDE